MATGRRCRREASALLCQRAEPRRLVVDACHEHVPLLDDPIDGAYWAGPPFSSAFWNYVQNQRNPGTPWVLPTIGDGSLVRYASHTADASEAVADWGDMRIVFLQYSSDPVVFYDPRSLWRAPPWMLEPPAEDVSDTSSSCPS
jgi:uncharacterized membrane protein